MDKHCPKCDQDLPESSFARKGAGFQAYCRECKKALDAIYYQQNKIKYLEYNKAQYWRMKDKIDELKSVPCADCGGTFPPCAMDFDHVNASDKGFNISDAVRKTLAWSRLMEEIAKCEVVCANCHRIRTWLRKVNPAGSNPAGSTCITDRRLNERQE